MKCAKKRVLGLALALVMAALALGAPTVGADEPQQVDPPDAVIDFLLEVLYLEGELSEEGVIMYSLGVREQSIEALSRARWHPTHSGAIDISRFIPARYRPGRPYIIAVRWSHAPIAEGNVLFVEIPTRPQLERRSVVYDAALQGIRVPEMGFEARLENDWHDPFDGWEPIVDRLVIIPDEEGQPAEGGGAAPRDRVLAMPAFHFPSGGTALVRRAALCPEFDDEVEAGAFASRAVRVRIPPQPRAPQANIAISAPARGRLNYFISGVSESMEVFIGEDLGAAREWAELRRNITVADFDRLFEGGVGEGADGAVRVYIRFRATARRPASAILAVEFDRAEYDEARGDN